MSKDSQKTESQSLQLPKAPDYVTDPLEGIIGAVYNLGSRNPQDFVPGPTGNDMASFNMGNSIASRYGMAPQYGSTPTPNPSSINVNRNQGGGGLFSSLGMREPTQANYDYNAIAGARPDIQSAYNTLTPQQHSDIARVTGNPDGRVSLADFTRFQIEENAPNRTPADEARLRQLSGFTDKPTDPRLSGRQSQPGRDIMLGADNRVQMGAPAPQAAQSPAGFNPLELYGQAAAGTRAAGTAAPNLSDSSDVFSLLLGERGPSVSAGSVSAQSLLDNLPAYMSTYTNDVVDTTLSGFDVDAERTRAARAAAAAGSGANRGTRNSIFEAVLEGELARERAGTEAGLRDQAFNTGAGLSADDANRRQSASQANAELAQRASEANAQMELSRMLNAANMMYGENQFNANQMDEALARTLSASGQLANIGSTYQGNERADIGLLSQLGAQQRDIQRQQSTADIALLDTIANLLGGMGVNTSQVTGVANSGSTTQRARPGLLSTLGSVVDIGAGIAGIGTGIQDSGSKRIAALAGQG